MCGISGIISLNSIKPEEREIRLMMETMKHRGPDDEGVYIDEKVALGHLRLSIIDLSSDGKQPFVCNDNRYYLIYNGEIYNYLELKSKLSEFEFKTKTDTEVLLYAWKKWGIDCLSLLNGMFAFIVYDKLNKDVFVVRDRFGIKPVYYYRNESKIAISSEIKPLLGIIDSPLPNNNIIYDYLMFDRVGHTENTFFKGINKLQHGHYIHINLSTNRYNLKKWYDLKTQLKEPFVDADEYRNHLISSIKLRLRSDVPVGALLSGGIDSSSILSLWLKEFDTSNLNTFSAVYGKNMPGDESEYIKEYEPFVKKMWYVTPTAQSLFDDMNSLVRCIEEPFPTTSIYAQYKLHEELSKHVTVIISGQGADEALAGYHYFFGYYYKELIKNFKLLQLAKEIGQYYKVHNSLYSVKSFLFFILTSGIQQKLYQANKKYISINPDYTHEYSNSWKKLYSSSSLHDSLINHFKYKLEHMLLWGDKISMNFSTEMRFPFLDHTLVEKTIPLKYDKLMRNATNKVILRAAMKGILPELIYNRKDKVGFETPQKEWFRMPLLKEFIFDLVSSANFKNRGYINKGIAVKMLNMHLAKKADYSNEIWKWLSLELWFRSFIDKNTIR
jgi:asparagine synthase (glutamine-hydrolysing)